MSRTRTLLEATAPSVLLASDGMNVGIAYEIDHRDTWGALEGAAHMMIRAIHEAEPGIPVSTIKWTVGTYEGETQRFTTRL